jgi:molybdenum cofactor biosynthesis protein MoaC
MVDVGSKPSTRRSTTASGRIMIPKLAFDLVTSSYPVEDDVSSVHPGAARTAFAKARRKGDALTIAQLAAIMGAKQTSALIPLCHPLPLTNVDVKLVPETQRSQEHSTSTSDSCVEGKVYSIRCTATVACEGRTGVEMEALTAVTIGLLTLWDMLKGVAGKDMEIRGIMVMRKSGGRSGDFERHTSDS